MGRRWYAAMLAAMFLIGVGATTLPAEACKRPAKRCVCKKQKRTVKKKRVTKRRAPKTKIVYRDRYIVQQPRVIVIREECPPPVEIVVIEKEVWEYDDRPRYRKPRYIDDDCWEPRYRRGGWRKGRYHD